MIKIERDSSLPCCTVLRPQGELDAFGSSPFRRAVADVVDSERLIIDLSEVGFIDSAGLGVLIGAIRETRELGGQVSVACSRPSLSRVLRMVGLHSVVTVADTVEEAALGFQAAAGTADFG